MSRHDLSRRLDRLGLTARQFARLGGYQDKRVLSWLDLKSEEPSDIPHHACVLVMLLEMPEVMEAARSLADRLILSNDEPDR